MASMELFHQLRLHGPPPAGWYASKGQNGWWAYRYKFSDITYEVHPLSGDFQNRYPGTSFETPLPRQKVDGILHPLQYQPGQFRWECPENTNMQNDVARVVQDVLYAQTGAYVSVTSIVNRWGDFQRGTEVTMLPTKFYHPADRPDVDHATPIKAPLPSENLLCAVLRSFGFSLVVVHNDGMQFEPWLDADKTPATITRWSLGANAELYRPIYVGYFMRSWYALLPRNESYKDVLHPKK